LVRALRRAPAVKERVRFVVGEVLGMEGARSYTLAGSGMTVFLRHRTEDLNVLAEIFVDRVCEPPAPAADRLAGGRLLDLGGHVGLFTAYALAGLGVTRVLALEPDESNGALFDRMLEVNGLASVELVHAAASNRDGVAPFAGGLNWMSRIGAAGEVATTIDVPTRDVFALLDGVDMLKMDIEGGEWDILGDARWTGVKVPLVFVEYHEHLCPSDDPRAACEAALESAGYRVVAHPAARRAQGELWGIRP
jgi:FkbM family methyltransferase